MAGSEDMAKLLVEYPAGDDTPGLNLSSLCRQMLLARDHANKTLLDCSRVRVAFRGDNEEREEQISYLEIYMEQSLIVPPGRFDMVVDNPMEITLNQNFDSFQRSVAKQFLKSVIGVPKWLVPAKGERCGIVYETQLPRDVTYNILSFLSLADIMAR